MTSEPEPDSGAVHFGKRTAAGREDYFQRSPAKKMSFYGVGPSDLEGSYSSAMGTVGVEIAIFLYETAPQQFKVSLRSREKVDVSEMPAYFGGGGHVRAAGCTMQGSVTML